MKIGVSRPTETLAQTRRMLDLAARHGFEGVQLKPPQYRGLSAAQFRETYAENSALVRGGLIFYVGAEIESWRAHLEPVLSFAAAVGAGHVCVCGAVGRQANGAKRQREAARALNEIGRIGAGLGLQISLHNHADSLFETAEDLDFTLGHLEPELCGLTLDTAHFAKAGIADIAALVRRFGPRIVNLHLKDMDAGGRFCPLGTGTLALDEVVSALAEIRYDQWLIVDDESLDFEVEDAFGISRDFLRKSL